MVLLWIISMLGLVQAAEWSYEGEYGTHVWHEKFASYCSGSRQSPIDIPMSDNSLQYNSSLTAFTMSGYDSMVANNNLTVKNNGHTIQIDILDNGPYPSLSGGGLPGTYEALQLHFHWGPKNTEGSEHTFRGRMYPLELHIVHKKTDYPTVIEALSQGDGLAVLGVFFVISDHDNEALNPLITQLSNIRHKGDNSTITIDFSDVMPADKTEYYRYMGSLTTPACNEAVVWTVFENKNTISQAQMDKFRELYENKAGATNIPLKFNYRPVKPLNGRTVSKSYIEAVPPSFHWGYHAHEAPEYWPDYYDTCTGPKQSPINIPKEMDAGMAAFDASKALDTLEFQNYNTSFTGTIKNNGHTIQVDIPAGTDLVLANGGLQGTYRAAQFHFHWGPDNKHGSEHMFQGQSFPLELHIVHYKESYGSLTSAFVSGDDDALAVVGFFFQVVAEPNPSYADIISALLDVKHKGSSKDISGVNLLSLTNKELRLNNNTGSRLPFFRYQGGLTTPPCYEIVTWTVMRNYIPISAQQLAAFREVTHIASGTPTADDKIKENYRPVQQLGTRKVYSSYDYLALTGGSPTMSPSFVTMVTILMAGFLCVKHMLTSH